jgi:hypothetical protein
MYCPKCGTQNIESAQYCRGCGENISLVPQALAGQLPERRAAGHDTEGRPFDEISRRLRREKDPPRLDKIIKSGFMGLAFLIIAIILAFSADKRHDYWYWLLIPAFAMIGGGVAEYVRLKQGNRMGKRLVETQSKTAIPSATTQAGALPPLNTSELVQPPSVTESTTRHLGIRAEAPIRNIEGNDE